MMKILIMHIIIFCAMSVISKDVQNNQKWTFHSELLKESLDTSHWRECYSADLWHVRCIFVDMDDDREDELIALSPSGEDRMGNAWVIYKRNNNGQLKPVYHSGNIYFLCNRDSFYKLSFNNGNHKVVGLDMDTNFKDKGHRQMAKPSPDCKLIITNDGKYMLEEIKPDFDTCFQQRDIVSIERLYPEWYFGFDFEPPRDVPHSVYTQRMPYKLPQGDLRHGGGICSPRDFGAFVAEYRREVKVRMGGAGKVTVYAVFLDADNDGDGDCYLSSDAEMMVGDEYSWSLYIYNGGLFSKAKEAVFPVSARKGLCKLPNTVNAGKTSFCRVIRYDVPPTFVVLDKENMANLVVREVITDYQTHRMEKLPCVEYKE